VSLIKVDDFIIIRGTNDKLLPMMQNFVYTITLRRENAG